MARDPADTSQISIRVPNAWLARLDALAVALSRPGIDLARADALRAAIAKGIEMLEREVRPTARSLRGVLSALFQRPHPRAKGHWTVDNAADDAGLPIEVVHAELKRVAKRNLISLSSRAGSLLADEMKPYEEIIATLERAGVDVDAPLKP